MTDRVSRHKNIVFPGHKHANLYDVCLIEPAVRQAPEQWCVFKPMWPDDPAEEARLAERALRDHAAAAEGVAS
jgi:hypothetical protein